MKSFTPLQTYKVLKHCNCQMVWNCSFTPLQTYKVLKQICVGWEQPTVLHHYKLTRFSNWRDVDSWAIEFYTITNLQGSQTPEKAYSSLSCFTPLQTYKVLKPTMGQTPEEKRFTPLQTYKVLKL